MNKITNFILSKTEPPKESGWLKPLDNGSYGMYVFSNKGWVSTGITKLKIGDNVDITPIDGKVIITDDKIAVGTNTVNDSDNSTVIGFNNTSSGNKVAILGNNNTSDWAAAMTLLGYGNSITDSLLGASSTLGYSNHITQGRSTTVVGVGNDASGQKIAVFGNNNTITSTDALSSDNGGKNDDDSNWSTTVGQWNKVSDAYYSTTVGSQNTVKGYLSIVIGSNNTVSGKYNVTVGYYNDNSVKNGVALGESNVVSGESACALGTRNTSSALQSVAVGMWNSATAAGASALGYYNAANGLQSTAVGFHATTTNFNETAVGTYNLSESDTTYFSVGNGAKINNTPKYHNIMMSNQAGDLYIVEKTPTDDSSIIYYEAPMKRLQTWLNEKADTADVDAALEKKQDVLPKVWANILSTEDTIIEIDDQPLKLPAHQSVIIKDFKKVRPYVDENDKLWQLQGVTRFDFHYNDINVPMDYLPFSFSWHKGNTGSGAWITSNLSITDIDVSCFDTSEMTSMAGMFYNLTTATTIDIGGFNTSKVTRMESMFANCKLCTTLDVSRFDTSNVTRMEGMFANCIALTTLDVSKFDTSKVVNISGMFSYCEALQALDVSNWDTSQVRDMSSLFYKCQTLTKLDVSNFDLTHTTYIGGGIVQECTHLSDITFGEGWGKNIAGSLFLNLSSCASVVSYKLTDNTFNSMLNMYDRVTNGLTNTFTIQFSSKHNIPDGWTDKMTAKGYTIVIS